MTENELLLRMKAGDPEAFNTLYDFHCLDVYRKIISMVKIENTADELTQDLFVKIWDKRHLIDPSQPFRFYLFKIAQRLVIDFYRKASRDEKLKSAIKAIGSAQSNTVENGVLLKESQHIFNQAINRLPLQQQRVFQLCKIEGRSYQEVSELLGISTATINNHIVRATKAVRMYFNRHQ